LCGVSIIHTNNGLPTPATHSYIYEAENTRVDSCNAIRIESGDKNNGNDDNNNHDYRHYLQQPKQQHFGYSPIVERSRRRREQQRRYRRPTQKEKERAIRKPHKQPVDDDDNAVRIRYRSKARGEALGRIIDGSSRVLAVVLPTVGGKTLLFTAPACLEEDVGVMIVVVPFGKLIDETVREAQNTVGDCLE
jgi:hypothetical protein